MLTIPLSFHPAISAVGGATGATLDASREPASSRESPTRRGAQRSACSLFVIPARREALNEAQATQLLAGATVSPVAVTAASG